MTESDQYRLLSNEALDKFKIFCAHGEATGRWPSPRVAGAFDEKRRYGRDAELEQPDEFRTRTMPRRHETDEFSGLEGVGDAELCDHLMRRVAEAGASVEERAQLEQILERLTRNPAEAATDAEQKTVTGRMTGHAMDSERLRLDYLAGKLSTRDYEEQILHGIRRPVAARGAVPFSQMFGRSHVRQGY
jgi:hypothetical protein